MGGNDWTQAQRQQVGAIYDILARALPVEGRDYTITFAFTGTAPQPHVNITPITDMGKDWIRYAIKELQQYARHQEPVAAATDMGLATVPAQQSVI